MGEGLDAILLRVASVEQKRSELGVKVTEITDALSDIDEQLDNINAELAKMVADDKQVQSAHYLVATVQRMILNPAAFCHEQIRSLEADIEDYCREYGYD